MFLSVEEAIRRFAAGEMLIIVDDADRENEGDVCIAAEKVTPEAITFMVTQGRGLVCLPITEERALALELPVMVERNEEHMRTAFTISIDARNGITTGISARDRATTVRAAVARDARAADLVRPGHVFPLISHEGGVLKRAGHTEAAVDLARLGGLEPAAVVCEVLNDDGSMARLPDLEKFAEKHGLGIVTIADLIAWRRHREKLVTRLAEATLPSKFGTFRAIAFEDSVNHDVHIALIKGTVDDGLPVLTRMHSECLTGDTLGSLRCDCGEQLQASLRMIEEAGRGCLVYLRQEGRGIGLGAKIADYALQDEGFDTVEANRQLGFPPDLRDYGIGAQILVELGITKLLLLTNNPKKIAGLEGYGIEVVDRVPIEIPAHPENRRYLLTKKTKLGHIFTDL